MGATDFNSKGHFESRVICDLNDRLLAIAGTDWRVWRPFDTTFFDLPGVHDLYNAAAEAIASEFGPADLFVLKDPRLCVLLPFWLRVLNSNEIVALPLLTVRNPAEVACSLATRDGLDEGVAQLTWLRHVLSSEAASRGMHRTFTTYDLLLENWQGVVEGIANELGLRWPVSTDACFEQVEEFLTAELRHHEIGSSLPEGEAETRSWSFDTHRIFSRWAEEKESGADYARLDEIRGAFDASLVGLGPVMATAERASEFAQRAHVAERRVSFLEQQNRSANQQVVDALAINEGMLKRLDAIERERDVLEQRSVAAVSELSELMQVREALTRQLADFAELESRARELELLEQNARNSAKQASASASRASEIAFLLLRQRRWVPSFVRKRLRRLTTQRLASEGLFDEVAYLDRNPDVADSQLDPLTHYLRHGMFEGRDPT